MDFEACDAEAIAPTQGASHDHEFHVEQEHLSSTHAKLRELAEAAALRILQNTRELQEFKGGMIDELSPDFDHDDFTMETYAAYDVMNNVVDSFNIALDSDAENLRRLNVLLRKPYFARVRLKFAGKDNPRDIYLGAIGIADENHRQLIVDWRSPVAETYYNQDMGHTSYWVNGKRVEADLELRRQFDIEGDKLKAYFDTSVAIEDPMLLASLNAHRSAQLASITATIQREQNAVIRHEDVPALLVRGIAGSGKTSVMLQRIAFLLFRQREALSADHVYLITPNPVFERYIWNVLPELGEKNPRTLRWAQLLEKLGPGDRSLGDNVDASLLERIDELAPTFVIEQGDVREIAVGGRVLLSAQQIWNTVSKHAARVSGPRLMMIAQEDLEEKLSRRVSGLASNDGIHEEMLLLDDDEQERVFGHVISPVDEDELRSYASMYLEDLCAPAFRAVETFDWLRLDRIGMRMLGTQSLSAGEWVWLKMALTASVDTTARYVMVDEVQDYTKTQLMVLARYFSRAHFLLLGDPNQAISAGNATFEDIREVFERARGKVCECELMTSYRSSPEITNLFASLLSPDERIRVSSVHRPGVLPSIIECHGEDEYLDRLVGLIDDVRSRMKQGLAAVVASDRRRVRWLDSVLQKRMGDRAPAVVHEATGLPPSGVVLIDLKLAKGLEFDSVVVCDAQNDVYGDDDLSRRRLYTAVSRATREVSVISEGPMTQLLSSFMNGDATK